SVDDVFVKNEQGSGFARHSLRLAPGPNMSGDGLVRDTTRPIGGSERSPAEGLECPRISEVFERRPALRDIRQIDHNFQHLVWMVVKVPQPGGGWCPAAHWTSIDIDLVDNGVRTVDLLLDFLKDRRAQLLQSFNPKRVDELDGDHLAAADRLDVA